MSPAMPPTVIVSEGPGVATAHGPPPPRRAHGSPCRPVRDPMQVWRTTDAGAQWPCPPRHHADPPSGRRRRGQDRVRLGPTGKHANDPRVFVAIVGNTVMTTAMYTTHHRAVLAASWTSPSDGWATASSVASNDLPAVLFRTVGLRPHARRSRAMCVPGARTTALVTHDGTRKASPPPSRPAALSRRLAQNSPDALRASQCWTGWCQKNERTISSHEQDMDT